MTDPTPPVPDEPGGGDRAASETPNPESPASQTPAPQNPQTRSPQTPGPQTPQTLTGRGWFIPAATFILGLVLGGVVIGVMRSGSTDTAAPPPSTVTSSTETSLSTAGPDSTATVVVPAQCLKLADDSRALIALARDSVSAARDLDASRLSDLVRQLDESQRALGTHADACRAISGSVTSGTTSPPGTGSLTSTGVPSTS